MSAFDIAKARIESGHKVRFYQDFYGRQSVKVYGGWMFWRSRRFVLQNEEIVELKHIFGRRRKSVETSLPSASQVTTRADAA